MSLAVAAFVDWLPGVNWGTGERVENVGEGRVTWR
jgi:hypothetical protein